VSAHYGGKRRTVLAVRVLERNLAVAKRKQITSMSFDAGTVRSGVEQAGTVYSVQGFETQHVGVILGPDLVVRNGRWSAQPDMNYSNSLRRKPPDVALPYLKRIYRTLLSRPMESCSVFCMDA
jgi:DUF2075 family protein